MCKKSFIKTGENKSYVTGPQTLQQREQFFTNIQAVELHYM